MAAQTAGDLQRKAAAMMTEFGEAMGPEATGVDKELGREDATLADVIAQADFLTELQRNNRRLIKHLSSPPVLTELVGYIVNASGDSDGMMRRFQLPFAAAEAIIAAPPIAAALATENGGSGLDALFSFLSHGEGGGADGGGSTQAPHESPDGVDRLQAPLRPPLFFRCNHTDWPLFCCASCCGSRDAWRVWRI